MTNGPLVQIEGVSRDFVAGEQTIHALKDVSFSVEAGDFIAVIGRSGSGKTTLLNIIAGLDAPTAGKVWIDGQDVTAMSEPELVELRRHKIGFVFQSFGLLPLLSAYENVEIALRIAGAGIRERSSRAKEVLDMVHLGPRMHHRPYELSGGEQQRVAIARSLANRPAIVLADEPTGELDSTTAESIFQLLLEVVARENISIITTTHDRLVMEKARRVLELADGALVSGETYFERDRRQAVSVPWTPEEAAKNLPTRIRREHQEPAPREEASDPLQWTRPQQRGVYHPPGPPHEPL